MVLQQLMLRWNDSGHALSNNFSRRTKILSFDERKDGTVSFKIRFEKIATVNQISKISWVIVVSDLYKGQAEMNTISY